jgi:hypothetical protein
VPDAELAIARVAARVLAGGHQVPEERSVADQEPFDFDAVMADNARITAALERAAREAALTHARLGRSLPDWRDGKVVWMTPAEIFAQYGLDENARPVADVPAG